MKTVYTGDLHEDFESLYDDIHKNYKDNHVFIIKLINEISEGLIDNWILKEPGRFRDLSEHYEVYIDEIVYSNFTSNYDFQVTLNSYLEYIFYPYYEENFKNSEQLRNSTIEDKDKFIKNLIQHTNKKLDIILDEDYVCF